MKSNVSILASHATLDNSLQERVWSFLNKLIEDHTSSSLHIEPITDSADSRVRTGRVTQKYRAVLFKLGTDAAQNYVYIGTWNHDDAIEKARVTTLSHNPINGSPELKEDKSLAVIRSQERARAAAEYAEKFAQLQHAHTAPLISFSATELQDKLGFDEDLAQRVVECTSEDQILAIAETLEDWRADAIIELTVVNTLDELLDNLGISSTPLETHAKFGSGEEDAILVKALQQDTAQKRFAFVGSQDELRRVIATGNFRKWTVFLHPDQRSSVDSTTNGPTRLSGGAGTGKTVVLIHRANRLATDNPDARIVLTTFTTNLAEHLKTSLIQLNPHTVFAQNIGDKGIYVAGIDQIASRVFNRDDDTSASTNEVFGQPTNRAKVSPLDRWPSVLDRSTTTLKEKIASPNFLKNEYITVILANKITSAEEYFSQPRSGRQVRLGRKERAQVWNLVNAYRSSARTDGLVSFEEVAALATEQLRRHAKNGEYMADHVLADECQDFNPCHWQLLRALVDEHRDDMFLAEDSHQRIYGQKIVLGHYGINIMGRGKKLRLNYRTTLENLRLGMDILSPGDYTDLDGEKESSHYISARSGPEPTAFNCANSHQQYEQIAAKISEWLDSGIEGEHIALLGRTKQHCTEIVAGLAQHRIGVSHVERGTIPEGSPVAMTMHRAKGTEFRCVVVVGASERDLPRLTSGAGYSEADREDFLLRERSLLYVAATRARDELVISWIDQPTHLLPASFGT